MTTAHAALAVCRVCAGPIRDRFAVCYCCETLIRQLQLPLVPVAAMTRYQIGDVMHRRLRGYKDAEVAEARATYAGRLASLVDTWLATNGTRLRRRFGSGWSVVASVPSSHRPAGAPVDAVIARVPRLERLRHPLLVGGTETTDHLVAARRGFEVRPGVDRSWLRNQRVLVVDDSLITGARAQSGAAALRLAGARVAGVVVIGRVVTSDRGRRD
jgi:predicted amidophosphoribosyltransferase